jgi:hypothetical protein
MKKSGTVVIVLSSFSEPAETALSSGLPVDLWCPRVAGCFGTVLDGRRLGPEAEVVVLVVVVDVATDDVPSERDPVGCEAVVEVDVVLDVELALVVDPEVVVEEVVPPGTVIVVEVVEVVGVELVVLLELVVLDVELEVALVVGVVVEAVAVLVGQVAVSDTCVRSSVVKAGRPGSAATSAFSRSCWLVAPVGTGTPW